MSASWPVEIVNTGTELLFGSVVNTHLAYLGQQLFSLGLRIDRQTTVPDGLAIVDVVREATSRSQLVIITGGVCPPSEILSGAARGGPTDRTPGFTVSGLPKIAEQVF